MTTIHVCPLSQVEARLAMSGAESVVSLLALGSRVPAFPTIAEDRRLHLALSDIQVATDGYVLPEAAHVTRFLAFIEAWDRRQPVLIHCYAGVSRSTAAAFIALCALDPATSEAAHAAALRRASPQATPNAKLVALADAALERDGRMVAAVAAIGRGAECFEGVGFSLDVSMPSEADAPGDKMR